MFVVFMFPESPLSGDSAAEDMNYSIVVLGGIMLFSVIYYYFPKYGGVNWFRGPVRTVEDGEKAQKDAVGDDVREVDEKKGERNSSSVKVESAESG